MSQEAVTAQDQPSTKSKPRYSIIRVKDTTYLRRPCYAISFQDISHHMEAL